MDQDANAGLGVIQFDFHREPFRIHRTAPVIGCDGIEMGVLKKGNECSQNTILGDSGRKSGGKKERADKEAAPKDGHKTSLRTCVALTLRRRR